MRPRPDAAENRGLRLSTEPAAHEASMRPRPDAAENLRPAARITAGALASMRPRPDAAENHSMYGYLSVLRQTVQLQ